MFDSFQNQSVLIELKKEERKTLITFITFVIILLLLVANSIYLTFYVKQNKQPNSIVNTIRPTPTPLVTTAPTYSPTPTTPAQSINATNQSVKDFFIPFGIGSNQASDWIDIPGSQVTIDFGSYQNIKQILFEVAVSIPTANESASVRLFNETDHHPVWYSEVTTTNNVFAASSPIIWDSGRKVYQVQMKTSLSFLASLTLARLHIILN